MQIFLIESILVLCTIFLIAFLQLFCHIDIRSSDTTMTRKDSISGGYLARILETLLKQFLFEKELGKTLVVELKENF